jgi:ferredoxin
LKEFLRPGPEEGDDAPAPQVILGARPCDAAGAESLDRVMRLEYRDELWRARRSATTIVTIACERVERSCFCSAVGSGPDSSRGADAILVPLVAAARPPPSRERIAAQLRRCVDLFLIDSEPFPGAAGIEAREEPPRQLVPMRWVARAVTLRGAVLLDGRGLPVSDVAAARVDTVAPTAREVVAGNLDRMRLRRRSRRVDREAEARLGLMAADGGELLDGSGEPAPAGLARLPEWLARNHDHDLWKGLAERCRSCGNCSAVCSTSPCFDMDAAEADARRRRDAERSRSAVALTGAVPGRREHLCQRLMHKFSTHPRRFDQVLCTGCGRCSRSCEGGVNLPEVLGSLVQLAYAPARIST